MQNKKLFAIMSFIMAMFMMFTFSFSLFAEAGDSDKPITGEEFEIVDDCVHDFSDTYRYDKKTHWHFCKKCGEKQDEAEHTLNDEGKCTVCNFGKAKLGDVNGDDIIDVEDLILIRKHMVSLEVPEFNALAADINGDGKVNAVDLTLVRKYLANFPGTGIGE